MVLGQRFKVLINDYAHAFRSVFEVTHLIAVIPALNSKLLYHWHNLTPLSAHFQGSVEIPGIFPGSITSSPF
jgi:hypothetical protein